MDEVRVVLGVPTADQESERGRKFTTADEEPAQFTFVTKRKHPWTRGAKRGSGHHSVSGRSSGWQTLRVATPTRKRASVHEMQAFGEGTLRAPVSRGPP
jgi:hypothetical protein